MRREAAPSATRVEADDDDPLTDLESRWCAYGECQFQVLTIPASCCRTPP